MAEPLDALVFYVPRESTNAVLTTVFEAGAGTIGDYQECAFVTPGRGQFRPVRSASPTIGALGGLEYVDEDRVEVVLPRRLRATVVAALRSAHPYEEPAFHVLATVDVDEPPRDRRGQNPA
ncbi:MAG: hypothetical protein ABJA74_13620 [Lapillicoccus sp.]